MSRSRLFPLIGSLALALTALVQPASAMTASLAVSGDPSIWQNWLGRTPF